MNPIRVSVDPRYSAPDVQPPTWASLVEVLAATEVYALTSLLPDSTPHTVPVAGAWLESGFWFCTGEHEQKVRNLLNNPRASVHVGGNQFMTGMNLVVRGSARLATSPAELQQFAAAVEAKYPEFFRFDVTDGALLNAHGNRALAFCLQPEVAHAFTRGADTVQARYEFA